MNYANMRMEKSQRTGNLKALVTHTATFNFRTDGTFNQASRRKNNAIYSVASRLSLGAKA